MHPKLVAQRIVFDDRRLALGAMVILLTMLTLARGHDFWETSPPRRLVGLAGLVFVFVFALPPTMIFEVNVPQLEYLAGTIDRNEFLLRAVSGTRVWREIEQRRDPGRRWRRRFARQRARSPAASRAGRGGPSGRRAWRRTRPALR